MKKVLVVLALAAVAGTSCKKETNYTGYEGSPVLNANIGDKLYFQVIAVETSGNELKTREAWIELK
jgi:hypothetical protein